MKSFSVFVLGLIVCVSAFGAEAEYAWRDSSKYRASDFERNFPVDAEWGKKLEAALPGLEQRRGSLEDPFELLRRGIRTLRGEKQMSAMRWFGNAYVWGHSPPDPKAVELMYHAAGSTNSQISYNAIYFGISTVRPMTESILHALADIGMKSDDPNVLSRIAWGGAGDKEKLVGYLKPYLESSDAKERAHAEDLKKIFSGEVKAFAWAAEKAKAKATEKYSGRLEEIREALVSGDSKKRKETMDLIERESIALIMDESFIGTFAKAAEDADEKVRNAITITVGSQWVWGKTQPKEAIDLMLKLSRDVSGKVRYNANYYGLSTIRNRSDEVVSRMVELLMLDGIDNRDFRGRVTWGLKEEKETVRRVLKNWMEDNDSMKALFAYGFYLDVFGEKPERVPEVVQTPEKEIARMVGIGPTDGFRARGTDDFFAMLRTELPGREVLWINDQAPPFVMAREGEIEGIRSALLNSPRFKIVGERALKAEQIIRMGKEGSMKFLD